MVARFCRRTKPWATVNYNPTCFTEGGMYFLAVLFFLVQNKINTNPAPVCYKANVFAQLETFDPLGDNGNNFFSSCFERSLKLRCPLVLSVIFEEFSEGFHNLRIWEGIGYLFNETKPWPHSSEISWPGEIFNGGKCVTARLDAIFINPNTQILNLSFSPDNFFGVLYHPMFSCGWETQRYQQIAGLEL